MTTRIVNIMTALNHEQLANMAELLNINIEEVNADHVASEITNLYRSRLRDGVKSQIEYGKKNLANLTRKFGDKGYVHIIEDQLDLTYEDLIFGLASKLNVNDEPTSLAKTELYITHAVIVKALGKMKPEQRIKFFGDEIDIGSAASVGNHIDTGLSGPMKTMAALGAANSAGFGLYTASSTALAFVTQAANLTLPFVAYTGLSQTLAAVTGPPGWFIAAGWLTYRATEPNWNKLLNVILYLINTRTIEELKTAPSHDSA